MRSLEIQVCAILHSKIHRIAVAAYIKANDGKKRYHPYTLPEEAHVMVAMLGRTAIATDDELEAMAHYATTGAVREATCS